MKAGQCVQARLALLVVSFLGWIIILCIGGSLLVTWTGVEPPNWFKDIALIAIGAMAALLSRPGSTDQVEVTNTSANPVPTEPQEK